MQTMIERHAEYLQLNVSGSFNYLHAHMDTHAVFCELVQERYRKLIIDRRNLVGTIYNTHEELLALTAKRLISKYMADRDTPLQIAIVVGKKRLHMVSPGLYQLLDNNATLLVTEDFDTALIWVHAEALAA